MSEVATWREKPWDDAWEEDDPMLPGLDDSVIYGLTDGYDDGKIDLVFNSYIILRRAILADQKMWEAGG